MDKVKKILALGCVFCCFYQSDIQAAIMQNDVKNIVVMQSPDTKSAYENIAISQVSGYVNIREQSNTSSAIVGKLYNNCAATIIDTVAGEGGDWYQIQSGNVTGYIKAEYFITGKEAEAKAKQVGKVYATVINADNLRLHAQPSLDSESLSSLSEGAHYLVVEESEDFYKLLIDIDLEGYVAKDYVSISIEFEKAVSIAEEQNKKAEEEKRKQEAEDAIQALQVIRKEGVDSQHQAVQAPPTVSGEASPPIAGSSDLVPASGNSGDVNAEAVATSYGPSVLGSVSSENSQTSQEVVSATRTAVVAYSKQFLGNPYAYGGTSLTNGADCSGFTLSVFAHFGIAIGRSSRDQAEKGREIKVENIQPGDLLFYASGNYINHVALYIGGGQVIHASNSTTGIVISPANYRTPCKAVTFLD